ncbi:mucoidy inhibitor MuiA family protein [Thermodesulfobacterium thermophilum]|uniref:mucoidy inhibitor MuiA family protein n=1 Tax=Thermodesulfobacterium thermophilum TaxID=886 RepID=UPI0003B6C3EA|nr:mucoidy inhibitor MuiA family protein [Thermodesulfobacterium thermophilum]
MKGDRFFHLILLTWLILLIAMVKANSSEITPEATIRKVIIYPQGAIVKKELRFKAQVGENVLNIYDLPGDLVDESVNISTKDEKGIKILDVKIEKTYLRKVIQGKIKSLEKKIEELEETITKNQDDLEILKTSIEFIKKSTPFSQNLKTNEAEVESFAKYLERSLKERLDRVSKLEKTIKKLNEEKAMIEKELSQLRKSGDFSKVVTVIFTSNSPKELTLELSYMVENAGWKPKYELRIDSKTKKVDVVNLAEIAQNAQEDWKNVELEISTAKPHHGPLPELYPWYIDVYTPRPPVVYKKLKTKAISPEEFLEEKEPEPEVREEVSSFTFIFPKKLTVPSDGKPHSIVITTATSDIILNYSAVPKLSSYAYLNGSFKNPLSYPITSGIVNIFVDGRFVNRINIRKQILPDENMDLSLGIDESIKIERKLVKKFTEYTGILSKEKRINYEYEIIITNGKKTGININLKDQFPVSRNEKIKVIRELPKEGEAKIGEDGIIQWELKLNPGEKKTFKVKFSIEAPEEIEIGGLE